MNIDSVLSQCEAEGVKLSVGLAGKLDFYCTQKKVSYDLKEKLNLHKPQLIDYLRKGVIIPLANPDLSIEEVLADKVVFKSIGGATQTLPRKVQIPVNSITLLDLPYEGNKEEGESGLDIQESVEKANNEGIELSFEALVGEITRYKNVLEQTYLDPDNDEWHSNGMPYKFRQREHTYEQMKVTLAHFIQRVHEHEKEAAAVVFPFTKARDALPEYQKYLNILKTHNSSDLRAKEYCNLAWQSCLKAYERIPEYKTFMAAKKRQALFTPLLEKQPSRKHIEYLINSLS